MILHCTTDLVTTISLSLGIMVSAVNILQLVSFLDLLAVGLIIPLIPNHVRQMGANHIHVGLLGSIYAGCQLGSGPLIGSLSDLKGRKSILILTLFVSGLCYVTIGLTSSVLIVLCVRAILGLFKQTLMLTKALVPDYELNDKSHSNVYGKMAAISGFGLTLGPVIGGHIIEDYPAYGFQFIAMVVGSIFILNTGLVHMLPKTSMNKIEDKEPKVLHVNFLSSACATLKQSVIELYKLNWSDYWDVFLLKALVSFAMSIYYSNYSLYLKTEYDLTPKYIGYVISFQGIIGSTSSYFMGFINSFYSSDMNYSLRNFHVFVLLCISLFGIIISFNIFMYCFWLIPLAIANAVGRLISLEMVLQRSKSEHRATLLGASGSVRSLTGVIAPAIAGCIGEFIGVSYVIYAALLSTSVGLLLSYQYRRKLVKVD